MKRFLAVLICLCMLSTILSSCTGSATTATSTGTTAKPAGTTPASTGSTTASSTPTKVVVGVQVDPATLAPWASRNLGRVNILNEVYQCLVDEDPVSHDLIPVIMKTYKQVDDVTYNCIIFDNIVDSAGNPFTAEDIAYSYTTAIGTGNHALLGNIKSVTALDKTTAQFVFKSKLGFGALLTAWTEIWVTTKAAVEASKDGMATNPVGTGPYAVTSFTKGASVVMEKNKKFWQKDAKYLTPSQMQNVDVIEWHIIADRSQIAIALQTGTIDMSVDVAPADIKNFKEGGANAKNYYLSRLPNNACFTLGFNCSPDAVTNNVNLRKALAYSYDPNGVIKLAYEGDASRTYAVGNSKSPDYIQDWDKQPYFEYDLTKAKSYLDLYLKETGKKAGDITIRILSGTADRNDATAEVLQPYFTALGIKCVLLIKDTETTKTLLANPKEWECTTTMQFSSTNFLTKMWGQLNANNYSWKGSKNFVFDPQLQKLLETVSSVEGHTPANVDAFKKYVDEQCYVTGICYSYFYLTQAKWVTKVGLTAGNKYLPGGCTYDWAAKPKK